MLSWKRSNKFYAEKLGVSEADVLEMIKELKPKQYKKIVNEEG
jgi:Mn-dependent DtxR family transcriptional regulator